MIRQSRVKTDATCVGYRRAVSLLPLQAQQRVMAARKQAAMNPKSASKDRSIGTASNHGTEQRANAGGQTHRQSTPKCHSGSGPRNIRATSLRSDCTE